MFNHDAWSGVDDHGGFRRRRHQRRMQRCYRRPLPRIRPRRRPLSAALNSTLNSDGTFNNEVTWTGDTFSGACSKNDGGSGGGCSNRLRRSRLPIRTPIADRAAAAFPTSPSMPARTPDRTTTLTVRSRVLLAPASPRPRCPALSPRRMPIPEMGTPRYRSQLRPTRRGRL